MLTFPSKKTKTEFLNPEGEFKDWKDAWPEIEALSDRLDAVRERAKACKPGSWAHSHWTEIADRMLRKWKLTVVLYQAGMRQRGPAQTYPIDYTWFERDDGIGGMGIGFTWLNDLFSGNPNLDRAWAMAQEEKLQKARQGLA